MSNDKPSPTIEVIDEEQVRREREEKRISDAEMRSNIARDKERFDLLLELLESGRFDEDWIYLMVQTGVMTDREEVLPCQDSNRNHHAYDFPNDRERVLELRRREAAGDKEPEPRDYTERYSYRKKRELNPTVYGCPLTSQVRYMSKPLPCIEAQRRQAEGRNEPDDPPYLQPDDPVVQKELRPCYVLGERALYTLLSPRIIKQVHAELMSGKPRGGQA